MMEVLTDDLKLAGNKVTVSFSNGQLTSIYDTKLARFTGQDVPVVSGKVQLPSIYGSTDAWLIIECNQGSESIEIARPYASISGIVSKFNVSTGEAKELERVARQIVDSQTRGFKFWLGLEELIGQGGDILPLPIRINEILRVWENAKLVYDVDNPSINEAQFRPTRSLFGVIADIDLAPWQTTSRESNNILQSATTPYEEGYFQLYFDYYVEGYFGSEIIPQAIKDAIFFLIDDLKCGNISFGGGYISSYRNNLGYVTVSPQAFKGTGNMRADLLLEPYKERIGRMAII